MIRGKKNFLPPHPLIMGFGVLFRLDESSLGSHLNERRVRGEEEEEEELYDVEEHEVFEEISDSELEKQVLDGKVELDSHTIPVLSEANSRDESDGTINNTTSSSSNHPAAVTKAFEGNDDSVSVSAGTSSALISPQLEDLIDSAFELGPTTSSAKNYGAKASIAGLEDQREHEAVAAMRDKPYISKAQRRMQKKGQKERVTGTATENGEEETNKNNNFVRKHEKNVESSKPGVGKISRGQRSKLKKMKEKYADQDEEERSIRMALLAVSSENEMMGPDLVSLLSFSCWKLSCSSHVGDCGSTSIPQISTSFFPFFFIFTPFHQPSPLPQKEKKKIKKPRGCFLPAFYLNMNQ